MLGFIVAFVQNNLFVGSINLCVIAKIGRFGIGFVYQSIGLYEVIVGFEDNGTAEEQFFSIGIVATPAAFEEGFFVLNEATPAVPTDFGLGIVFEPRRF